MKESSNNKGILLVIALIIIASFSRILDHYPNFTAIGAVALFGSAVFSRKYLAFLVPMFSFWMTDLFINNVVYTSESFVWFQSFQLYTIIPMALIVLFGIFLFKKVSTSRIIGGSLTSVVFFFIVSNFGVWLSPYAMFPKTLFGLGQTFVAGLPFALHDLAGTIFFSFIIFGSYYLITNRFPKLKLATIYLK